MYANELEQRLKQVHFSKSYLGDTEASSNSDPHDFIPFLERTSTSLSLIQDSDVKTRCLEHDSEDEATQRDLRQSFILYERHAAAP